MNISEEVSFDNRQRGNVEVPLTQSPSEPVATFTFDKDGHTERFPLFKKLFLALVIILTATLSFGLGRLSGVGNREGIKVEYDAELTTDNLRPTTASAINSISPKTSELTDLQTSVVASKNSSKYHYPYCPGAKQIAEKNKLTFASPAAAEASGYILASNCKPK
ncbi:MAG: hypothetical protein Q7R67_00865 [bacterium]|nr:hypothetical protein [bacterium]